MVEQTTNFGFTKPDVNEFYDVNVQNENWDKLDELLNEKLNSATLIEHLSDKNNPHEVSASQTGAFSSDNIEPLINELEKSIENGEVSTLQSAIQITNACVDANGKTFSGTGKGKLFISGNIALNLDYSPDITIDGKSIGKVYLTSPEMVVEIEFLESFVVTGKKDVSVYCNAVFY